MAEQAVDRSWHRYIWSAVAIIAVSLLTGAVPILRERYTFFFFWPMVLGIAWLWGTGPAVLATLLSALVTFAQLPPSGVLYVENTEDAIMVALFAVVGMVAAWVGGVRGRADVALQESQERFAVVANAAPVLIWMAGPDKQCTYFNKPWLDFTGRSLDRELGSGWLQSVHPDDRPRVVDTYSKAGDAREPFEMQYRLRRADGDYRHMLVRGTPLSADGRLSGYIGSCMDITEQQEAIESALAARSVAESASRAKDAFLATLSHELRAPLSPIITWIQMLREGHVKGERAKEALAVIERNARMQAQLIEDLLDVARIVEGKIRIQVRPVSLQDVIHHAVDIVRPAAEAKEIRLQLVLDTTVDAVSGDPDRLQQVVWNLLSNAVKFTPRGGRVHVVLERVNSHVEIAVSDSGKGISTEQLPRLFERFWQADSSTARAYTGLGLGLAIVRHLTELHGGTVTAESPGEGQGSTFTVKLPVTPLRAAGEETRRHPLSRDGQQGQPARLDGIRVLLVDDEPDANEALRVLLDHCGAEVRVAGSTNLALEVLNRWKPDVLLTDIGMPGEDGYVLLQRIRARADGMAQIPAIALTAYASSEDRTRLLSAGFQLHLAKPAEPGELTAAVAAVAARLG
jgi:PAS domain S-box-containing protein